MSDDEREVTDDPATWPAWLREHNERAHAALREARKRQREAERERDKRGET